jgi:hypothetical protein
MHGALFGASAWDFWPGHVDSHLVSRFLSSYYPLLSIFSHFPLNFLDFLSIVSLARIYADSRAVMQPSVLHLHVNMKQPWLGFQICTWG